MTIVTEAALMPQVKPMRPYFSSGPCAKRPGWSLDNLAGALLGRSHRSKGNKAKLEAAIEKSKKLLKLPADYRLAIVPASDTGAVEMALWSLLGARGVDVFAWESFGRGWVSDIVKQLRLKDVRLFEADYGFLPDMTKADPARDCVFTWNGTTSGVAVPNADWIADTREGLVICDATSAVFAYDLPWQKLDVITYSWQKALGGEGGHGVLILSPRAVERLQSYTPDWPLPKIFRLTKNGALIEEIFAGATINTPSMLCVEDYLDALDWAEAIGGFDALQARTKANYDQLETWVAKRDWVQFLAGDKNIRSMTSVCLTLVDPAFLDLTSEAQAKAIKTMVALLEKENVAYDIAGYRDAPLGLRIWCGATVEQGDIEALLPWLDWAYAQVKADF